MKITQMYSAWMSAMMMGLGAVSAAERLPAALHFNEYPIPTASSNPKGITRGLDNRLWFCESSANKIGRSTVGGAISEFVLPGGSSCAEVVAGPGGVYFTSTAKIGFLSASGVLTEYPIPSGNSAVALTRLLTGDIWFVEGTVRVGKLSGGLVTEYPLFSTDDNLRGIAAGPDGNLWVTDIYFSEFQLAYIHKVTPGGTLGASYPLGSNHTPFSITSGPDGALWFTDNAAAMTSIGQITTAGAITQYPLSQQVSLGEITVGPGGLWFTEYGASKIGRITTGGIITEFATPTSGAFPYGIIRGPDGAIWFTEQAGNSVARFGP